MWRLYQPLNSLLKFLLVTVVLSLLLGVLGNCAYDVLSLEGCTLALSFWPLNSWGVLLRFILVVIPALLLVGWLRSSAKHSYHRREARKSFALLKPVEELSPEDLGFQVLGPGERPKPHHRPFYLTYICRSASEENSNRAYTEDELARALREGKSFVLLGQPLDGKSRTLYEVVSSMGEYHVVRPSPSQGRPRDDDFSLLEGKRIILVLEDLHNYVGRQVALLEFREH